MVIYAVMGKTEGGQMIKPHFFSDTVNFSACTFPGTGDISRLKW
jgi:hypothetical protein